MNDDLEQRLLQLGNQPTTALDAAALAAMEARVMSAASPRRRVLMPLLAAAAAVLLMAGTVFAFRGDRRDSLQPDTTAALHTTATTDSTATTSTTVSGVATSVAPTTTFPTTTSPPAVVAVPTSATSPGVTTAPVSSPATVAANTPTTAPTTAPPTTAPPTTAPTTVAPAPPQPVPAASFALNVRRVDGELRFNWLRYEGPDGRRYVLVRVGPGGLTEWPPAPARVAATVNRIGITFTALDIPGTEPRRWVLAVVGADRELLAVSSAVTSN